MAAPSTEIDDLRLQIDAHRPFTPDLVERMQRWLQPQFIWASDGLGARDRLTLAEVTAFLERDVVSGGHPLDRFLSVERHERAFALTELKAREGGRIDLPFIQLLHRTLTEDARGEVDHRPGEWKQSESPETRRRGRRFRYSPPGEVPGLMTRLIEEVTRLGQSQTEHPVRLATWLYYHLHLIHPFETHNGHLARLAASCVLLHHGYPPLILDPRDLGPYLDALAACDATVPGGVQPLSPKIDVTPLELVVCEGLRRVAARLLDFIEGREVHASELPRRVVDDQEQLLASMLAQQDLSWRVRGSADVRALHGRLERLLRQLECKGPIYSIRVEDSDVVPTHQVWREFSPALPAGDSGIVGRISLVIAGEPTSNLRFPVSPRLRLVVVGTQTTAQVVLQWDDQDFPKANPGPPRAEQWPDAALDKLLTRAVDARRRAFEFRMLEENLSATAQEAIKKLLQEQPGRQSMRLRRITTRRGPSARLGKVQGVLAVPPDVQDGETTRVIEPPPTTPSGPRSPTARLDGLRPAEPPLSF